MLMSEVVIAAIVDSEGRGDWEIVEVHAELGVVAADGPGKIVGELIALFDR